MARAPPRRSLVASLSNTTPFSRPWGLLVDGLGRLFVADGNNDRVVVLSQGGTILANLTVTMPAFNGPRDVALDSSGNLYVADAGNGRIVVLNREGQQAGTIEGFDTPGGVAVDSSDNVYVADPGNDQVVQVPSDSSQPWVQLSDPAQPWQQPNDVTLDNDGNIYVCDTGNYRVVVFDSTLSLTQVISSSAFNSPAMLAVDDLGHIYLTDISNRDVVVLTTSGQDVTYFRPTVNGNPPYPWGVAYYQGGIYMGDQLSNEVVVLDASSGAVVDSYLQPLMQPYDIAFDQQGNSYITDSGNNRILILGPDGSQLAALPSTVGNLYGIAIDGPQRLYVVTNNNGVGGVYQLDSTGAVTYTFTLPPNGLQDPTFCAVNDDGTRLYVSDTYNSRIVMWNKNGQPSIIQHVSAFELPLGLALDQQGRLYVTDDCEDDGGQCGNVFVLNPSGSRILHTFSAGNTPLYGLALDAAGRIYSPVLVSAPNTFGVAVLSKRGVTVKGLSTSAQTPLGIGISPLNQNIFVVDNAVENGHSVVLEYQAL